MEHKYYFEKLDVWQNARAFVKNIYVITDGFLKKKNLELLTKFEELL